MLQVYTGNGKGKTTASFGLALRALGAGMKIYVLQFMKSLAYSEQKILKNFAPNLILQTTGKPFFIAKKGMISDELIKQFGDDLVIFEEGHPPKEYVQDILTGFQTACEKILSSNFQMVILDEVNVALFFGLLTREDLEKNLFEKINPATEIICTGRNAPDWLIEKADLVTEMKEIKHYYTTKGIEARLGIEN